MDRTLLFSDGSLSSYISKREKDIVSEIKKLFCNDVENTDKNEWIERLYNKYKLESPIISEDMNEFEKHVNKNEKTFVFYIPFTGNKDLFTLTPSTFYSQRPEGKVNSKGNVIEILVQGSNINIIISSIRNRCNDINKWLKETTKQCDAFNRNLKQHIMKYIIPKYEDCKGFEDLAKEVDICLKKEI